MVFLQTIEHVERPEEVLAPLPLDAAAGGRRATCPRPTCSRSRPSGAEKSDNPWHLREYRVEEFRALCASAFDRFELFGLFHARKLRAARAGAARRVGPLHAALGITKPFYDRFTPAIARATSRSRTGDLERALDFVAVLHRTG